MKQETIDGLRTLAGAKLESRQGWVPLDAALVLQEGLKLAIEEVVHYRRAFKRALRAKGLSASEEDMERISPHTEGIGHEDPF